MAAYHVKGDAVASGCPKAVLLRGEAVSPEDERLAGLLDSLGVFWQAVGVTELAGGGDWKPFTMGERVCVMTSANRLAALMNPTAESSGLPAWMRAAESVYIYGFAEDDASQRLLCLLTGNPVAAVRTMTGQHALISVSSDFPEISDPMSGLRFGVRIPEKQAGFDLPERSDSFRSIVSSNRGQIFVYVEHGGARLFLNSSAQVVDTSASCTKYFDVKENFCDTVPTVMYAKWAFGIGDVPEMNASLIVDDPPLKPRYGFMKYRDILRLMDEHNFATTIAFIPWNWHRTDSQTVRLFHERPEKLSLCVHGCDHTSKEFADRSVAVLNKRINIANQRMQLLGRRTDLRHDRVMLFPQGAFSASAARALKLNGFVAASNTEVVPVHSDENKTIVGDLLGVAIMKYASFPLFTRRYVAHGVENFAFDGLLGKPCLIAAHHDDFAGDARILLDVISKLNSLNWKLRWRSLGETISRTFRMRRHRECDTCVEMYGTNLIYRNSIASPNGTTFIKEESDFDCVDEVTVNGRRIEHFQHDGHLKFQAAVPPNESAELRIVYSGGANLPLSQHGVKYRAKVVLRRYLSEFRDNYLSQHELLQQGAVRIKEALRL
jgi:hypothetical protein